MFNQPRLPIDMNTLDKDYLCTICDESLVLPFTINRTLVSVIQNKVQGYTKFGKAKSIFDWMQKNISYGYSAREVGYKNSAETLMDRIGICGEMAYLYITMARYCGLQASYVHVERDYNNKKVNHACAGLFIDRFIMVDPAYYTFDIIHQKYTVLTDAEVLHRFAHWR